MLDYRKTIRKSFSALNDILVYSTCFVKGNNLGHESRTDQYKFTGGRKKSTFQKRKISKEDFNDFQDLLLCHQKDCCQVKRVFVDIYSIMVGEELSFNPRTHIGLNSGGGVA